MNIFKKIGQKLRNKIKTKPKSLTEVAIMALPDTVFMPQTVMPLHIFEERYQIMVSDLLHKKGQLALSRLHFDTAGNAKPSSICAGGSIDLVDQFPDGRKNILLEGHKRYQIVEITQEKPYLKALVKNCPDIDYPSLSKEQLDLKELRHYIYRWVFLNPILDDDYLNYATIFQKPHQAADFIAANFFKESAAQQEYLETLDRSARTEKVKDFLAKEIALLEKNKAELGEELSLLKSPSLH